MYQIIGLDIGYGFVKVTDGEKGYSFPSVIGDGYITPSFGMTLENVQPINDLKLEVDGNLYFVGKSALRHSNYLHRDLSYTRSVGNELEILYLAALSLFCNSGVNNFKVVTGLPVDRMHMANDLHKRIKGDKTIRVFRNNEFLEQNIVVEDLVIVPQPLGTYWSEYLDNFGQTNDQMSGRVGIIDIGFKTTDLSALEDGEYMMNKSKSTSTGLSNAYRDISSSLASQYGIEKESYALDEAVIKKEIRINGKRVDISNIIMGPFKWLANNTLVEINSLWKIAEFDSLILCGGGGQSVSTFLLPNLPQGKLASNPLTSNCIGFYNWGRNLWREVN